MSNGATTTVYDAGVSHVCGRDCACGTRPDAWFSRRCQNNQTATTRLVHKPLRRVGVRVG